MLHIYPSIIFLFSSENLKYFFFVFYSDDCLNESHYHVNLTSSRDIMRMLAFASCTVYMMGRAFSTYEKIRYRAFIKRVGRTIR